MQDEIENVREAIIQLGHDFQRHLQVDVDVQKALSDEVFGRLAECQKTMTHRLDTLESNLAKTVIEYNKLAIEKHCEFDKTFGRLRKRLDILERAAANHL